MPNSSREAQQEEAAQPAQGELPDWCKFVCPACKALAGQPCINGASCMERVLLQGLAEPPPELVWRHLVKRMFDAEAKRDALQAKLDAILKLVEGELPELDAPYEAQKAYALTLPTGVEYTAVEATARAWCRERQYLELR